jgi:hypothetical protein
LPYAGYPVIRPLKIGSPVPVHPDGIQQTAALLKQKALHTIDNCPTIIQFGEKRKPRNALGGNNMNQRVIYINTCAVEKSPKVWSNFDLEAQRFHSCSIPLLFWGIAYNSSKD